MLSSLFSCRRGFRSLGIVLIGFLFVAQGARAQLTWGLVDGTWNNNQSNQAWLSGSTPVPWLIVGTGAIFNGGGGNVTVSAVNATGLTFSAPGYTLAGATDTQSLITSIGANFTLNAAAPATIAVAGIAGTGSTTLAKDGSARLALSSTLVGFSRVQVNAGELAVSGTAINHSSTHFVLADAADAVLSFDLSAVVALIGDLSGGGSTGGVVRPGGTAPLTLTLAGATDATFGGSLRDNGEALLLFAKTGAGHQTLTGENTYTGPTILSAGRVTLAGNGSILNSAVTLNSGATLALDNTGTLLSNRLGDTRGVNLAGGTLSLAGNASSPTTETIGALLLYAGQSRVEATRTSGQSATLGFSTLTRLGAGAVLEFAGDGTVKFSSSANTNGILGGYTVIGNDWAYLDGSGNVAAFSAYAPNLTSGATTDNVRLTSSQTLVSANTTRNSLSLDPSGGDFTLNLGASGNVLKLTSGGLLTTGTGNATISGGQLTSNNGSRDLVAFVRGNLLIESPLVNVTNTVGPVTTTSSVSLTKAGEGTLRLAGENTYSGETRVLAGTLAVAGGAAIPDTSAISLGAGATLRLGGSTETVGGLSGTGLVFFEDGALTIGGAGLSGSPTISLGNGRLTVASAATTDFGGSISGAGGLSHSGGGSLTLNTAQSFSGPLRVSSGSLLLGGLDLLTSAPAVELAGGSFGFSAGLTGPGSVSLGLLTVSGDSVLQFPSSATIPSTFSFTAGSTLAWDGQLRVTNFTSGLDSLRFGTSAAGLTAQQLGRIMFEIDGALVGAQISANGFVTPSAIPEPSTTVLLAASAVLAVAVLLRRRRQRG